MALSLSAAVGTRRFGEVTARCLAYKIGVGPLMSLPMSLGVQNLQSTCIILYITRVSQYSEKSGFGSNCLSLCQ